LVTGDPTSTAATDYGEGVLEQRVLQKDLVVLGQVKSVDLRVVPIASVKSRLQLHSDYERYENTLLVEVDLRVQEYLKGEGPNDITAIVEGQYVFNTKEEEDCAKTVFTQEFGQLIDSDYGIGFLAVTDDPKSYHMGRARQNFKAGHLGHRTWLPGQDGGFYDSNRNELITLAKMRQRVASVLEEYNRNDDEKWRDCVYYKYFDKGRDPWAYRGIQPAYQDYRDHSIIFNGERVPVTAGTMVWNYPDPNGYRSELHMRLSGEDADLFEVLYHSNYELKFNQWRATSGGKGIHLAIWYVHPERIAEQWTQTVSAHVINSVEELAEGEYQFNLHVEDQSGDFVDCGQEELDPSKFTVIVDADRPTVPPAPANVEILEGTEGWTIGWDSIDGVDYTEVYAYRLNEDGEEIRVYLGDDTEDSRYSIRFDEMNGCGDLVYVEIWPSGDGETYLNDYGERSERIELRTEPCPF